MLVSPFSSNCTVGWTILICLCRFVVEPALKKALCFVIFSIFKLPLDVASLSGVTHSVNTQPHTHTQSEQFLPGVVSAVGSFCRALHFSAPSFLF